MKFFKHIPAALAALTAMVACDDKHDYVYDPADPTVPGQRVYFQESAYKFEVLDGTQSVSIDIYRPAEEQETPETVTLQLTDPSGLFEMPTDVTFEPGQDAQQIEISFDWTALEEDKPYTFDIAINEIQANEYAISATQITVTRSNWQPWQLFKTDIDPTGLGTYVFTQFYAGEEYPVRILQRIHVAYHDNMQYQMQWLGDYDDPTSWETFLEFTSADGGKTFNVPAQPFANSDYGVVYVTSTNNYFADPADIGQCTFNETTGIFTFDVIYFVPNVGYFGAGEEYFALDGYQEINAAKAPRLTKKAAKTLKLY